MNAHKPIIGYATGVFDMFHVGHLNILKRAKEQCDYLIVGVSSDEAVRTYKHKMPIVSLEDRMAIVGAIRNVDKVLVQENKDKFTAWQKYHYNILFHGDDWKDSDMYNEIERKLSEVGAKVVFLPHTPGVSTTILTEIIRKND